MNFNQPKVVFFNYNYCLINQKVYAVGIAVDLQAFVTKHADDALDLRDISIACEGSGDGSEELFVGLEVVLLEAVEPAVEVDRDVTSNGGLEKIKNQNALI